MATGTICSTFDIVLLGDLSGGKTFYAPRGFTLTGLTAQNTAASAGTLTISQVTTTDGSAAVAATMTAVAAGTAGAAAYFTRASAPGAGQALAVLQTSAATIVDQTAAVPGTSTTGVYTQITVTDSANQLNSLIMHCQANDAQTITVS
jgi:hypothetical protein